MYGYMKNTTTFAPHAPLRLSRKLFGGLFFLLMQAAREA